jgi:hypothetical protein
VQFLPPTGASGVRLGLVLPNIFNGRNLVIPHTNPTKITTVATTRIMTSPRFSVITLSILKDHATRQVNRHPLFWIPEVVSYKIQIFHLLNINNFTL